MVSTVPAKSLPHVSGYTLVEQLYSRAQTGIYRAVANCADAMGESPSAKTVIIKLLQKDYPSFSDLVQFRNQYSLTHNLSIPGVVRPLSLDPWQNGYALVMEDFRGISLHRYKQEHFLSLGDSLDIALQMAEVLNQLLEHHIVHKDIKPANILIHPESKRIQLIDFSIASQLPKEVQSLQNPNGLEGTLAYLSPEQTGRMNRGIDYRTDFYALGITLFELFTGQLPFQSNEPLELVHHHIARVPTAPHKIRPEIPPMVSAIILKLIAKNAEDRYQNALGLHYDLTRCLDEWQETGEIQFFTLGTRDLSDRFLIPEKLYGRESEVRTLLEAFSRVVSSSSAVGSTAADQTLCATEMMLVAGFSGIGKTAVVNEVHKPITQQQSYFIQGKFDQFNQNLPLSAFLQALKGLIDQLLVESDKQLAEWRRKILEAVGESGQVLLTVLPELEAIIGEQPEVPELSGSAAQNRFNQLFHQFIGVFTSAQRPLVIFLDDLQWADSASLQLIGQLMAAPGPLFLLGAYRDNEVSPAHPLMLSVEELKKTGATVNTITLTPLTSEDTNQLVADTLHCSVERSRPLTDLILRKTQGNPFFTTQFLKALHEEGHIRFNPEQCYWECEITEVAACAFTDDVVEFMAQQLQKLPPETQQILQLAACIGNRFDLETLAIVAETSQADAAQCLWQSLQEGLIIPEGQVYQFYLCVDSQQAIAPDASHSVSHGVSHRSPDSASDDITYRFLHDRVQQAAYSLIDEAHRQTTHLKIGQRLLKHASDKATEPEENLFEIVNHFNQGIAFVVEPSEQAQLAQLNLTAGRKAKSATAYQAAVQYLTTGIQLLRADCWDSQYSLALALHESAAEAALLCGDFAQMEQWAELVLQEAHTLLDYINIYELEIQAHTSQNQFVEAIAVGYEGLEAFGVTFPQNPEPGDIQQALQTTMGLLQGKEVSELAHLPAMSNSNQLAVIQLTSSIIPASFFGMPPLYPLLILFQIRCSIEYGNAPQSAFSYATYGVLLNVILNNLEAAEQFGQLGLTLAFESPSKMLQSRVSFVVGAFIKHHTGHLQVARSHLMDSYKLALESGDIDYVGYAAFHMCQDAYLMGHELTALTQSISAYSQVLSGFKQQLTFNYCQICQQAVLNLRQQCERPASLSGSAFQEATEIPQMLAANDVTGLYTLYVHKLILSYLFEEFAAADDNATQARQYLMGADGFAINPLFYCYDSLTLLRRLTPSVVDGQAAGSDDATIAAWLNQVSENQSKLKHWADHAPMNYLHKFELVEAERRRLEGDTQGAIEKYDLAIAAAQENGYRQEAALANELAARFYLDWGKERVAAGYMQEAYYGYARWGAAAKVQQLSDRYPQLLMAALAYNQGSHNQGNDNQGNYDKGMPTTVQETLVPVSTDGVTQVAGTQNIWLDFSAIMKAAQAISQEIELDKLLTVLMQLVINNAGAEQGYFLLRQGEQWILTAKADQAEVLLCETPIDDYADIPHSLIYSVARTHEARVFEDLAQAAQFAGDRYIRIQQPSSALCMPISRQGKLVGILYLENNLIKGAFTGDRIQTLQLLTSQAAISIENARLYQKTESYSQRLELEVEKKTQALNQKVDDLETALQKLKATQIQLIQTEKMSSLGQLVAGIAHEINNPINFIYANITHIGRYNQDLLALIQAYREGNEAPSQAVEALLQDIDLDFLVADSISLLTSLKNGSDRIKQIVLSLRNFARLDEADIKRVNIHEGLESTLSILQHRLQATAERPEISIVRDYGELPLVECHPGPINQVLMNVLNNSIDALADYPEQDKTIRVWTRVPEEGWISIHIADNGIGIPQSIQPHIFDPFVTTKPVGKGKGLGLSISHQIITEQHQGKCSCHSAPREGTEIIIEIPTRLHQPSA